MTADEPNVVALAVMKATGCRGVTVIMFVEEEGVFGAHCSTALPEGGMEAKVPKALRAMADQIENRTGEVVTVTAPDQQQEDAMNG